MRDSRSSLAVDGDHVGGEGEEVVAGLAGGGVARPLVHAEAARVDVAHVVRDDAGLADLVAGDGAGEAAHRGGGRGCGGQGRRVGEERREDGRACKSRVLSILISTYIQGGPSGLSPPPREPGLGSLRFGIHYVQT